MASGIVIGACVLLVAFALSIVSMTTLSWIHNDLESGGTWDIGLVQSKVCGAGGDACKTDSIASLCSGTGCDNIIKSGRIALGCGVASLFLCVLGAVASWTAYKKGNNLFKHAALVCWLAAGSMAILAVVLYGKQGVFINSMPSGLLDYAFIIYLFSSFGAFIGATVMLLAPDLDSDDVSRRRKYLGGGFAIMSTSIAVAIVMMCLPGWIGNCQPGETADSHGNRCYHLGLVKGNVQRYDSTSIAATFAIRSDACENPWCHSAVKGSNIIFATGIIGMVVCLVSTVLLAVAHSHSKANYRLVALLGEYVTAALMILGILLYAHQFNMGFSYLLMMLAGFCYFIATALMLVSGWPLKVKDSAADFEARTSSDHVSFTSL